MITETKAYLVGEQVFPTIQQAQKQELCTLLESEGGALSDAAKSVIERIVENTDEVVAILTCTPKAKPRKPRKDIGTKRKRKAEKAPQPALTTP